MVNHLSFKEDESNIKNFTKLSKNINRQKHRYSESIIIHGVTMVRP